MWMRIKETDWERIIWMKDWAAAAAAAVTKKRTKV